MGSSAPEAMSPISTIRRIRKADAVGRLRTRSDYYLWFFGQVHVKQLLVFLHFFLLVVSVWFMCAAGADNLSGLGFPGLDGFPPFDVHHGSKPDQKLDPSQVTPPTTRPMFLYAARNIVSGLGYFYFFSTIMGLIALRATDGVWQHESVITVRCTSPALLLFPFLLCMLSFGGGLFIWSVRVIRKQFLTFDEAHANDNVVFLIIESVRFVLLPCAIIWAVYIYFFYGCIRGFIFVYRRSHQSSSRKNGVSTVNSTSWSFRDRSSFTEASAERLNIKYGFLNRLTVGTRDWHSNKCAENPILRNYTRKIEGENITSLVSEEVNVSFGSGTSENNNPNRSFCGFNSSFRQLDTVHEESETQENTTASSETETATGANMKTRM
uniref:Transmembrane protein n=1 Tax=Haemonchus contortus TaxID=6289 RepID=A0A7I5E5Z3_HAECO|nr:unnamed protein product [Haemonchus contortus]